MYCSSSTDIVTSFVGIASPSEFSEVISDVVAAALILWYSTTKLVMGHPPSIQAARSKTIELEFTFIKVVVDSGAIGAEPLVWADTVSVLSPTPKSFRAYINFWISIFVFGWQTTQDKWLYFRSIYSSEWIFYLNIKLIVGSTSQSFKGISCIHWVDIQSIPVSKFSDKLYRYFLRLIFISLGV